MNSRSGVRSFDVLVVQARLCEQEAATAEQSACAQKLQEAVETGKGKLAESAAFMRKLQDEQTRAKGQIAEYATQVTKQATKKNCSCVEQCEHKLSALMLFVLACEQTWARLTTPAVCPLTPMHVADWAYRAICCSLDLLLVGGTAGFCCCR